MAEPAARAPGPGRPWRIAVGGFQHESNSFIRHHVADYAYFADHRDRPPLLRGEEILRALPGRSFALAGFIEAAGVHELRPLVWASGGAGGEVSADAFERIAGELAGRLSEALPVDAVYLDMHGAMVAHGFEDADGELLRRVRAIVGEDVTVVASLDFHANVTPAMMAAADALPGFRTYPHVDRVETGRRAARLVQRLLGRPRPAGRALRHAPFLLPLEVQCTRVEPMRGLMQACAEDDGELVSLDCYAGFPASDLYWCGPSVVAHADSQAAAEAACDALYARLLACEPRFQARLWPPAQAVAQAQVMARGGTRPVILADIQDNPGAGGNSDTTGVLKALLAARARDALIGFFYDPQAAARAHEAGEGATLRLALGGRCGTPGVSPHEGEFLVRRLAAGRFLTTGSVAGGNEIDLGPMALLQAGGVAIAVTSRRMQAFDPAPFHRLGADPAAQKLLVLKSSCHYRADFEALSCGILNVVSPGGFQADPAAYAYRRLRPGVRRRPGA